MSTGILWFWVAGIALIIYLIWIALKAPADVVAIEIEGQPKKEDSKETEPEALKEDEDKKETLWQYLTRDD